MDKLTLVLLDLVRTSRTKAPVPSGRSVFSTPPSDSFWNLDASYERLVTIEAPTRRRARPTTASSATGVR